jgi:murein L,D-transpeptidase YafK
VKLKRAKWFAMLASAAAFLVFHWLTHRNPDPLPADARADHILVKKSERSLVLLRGQVPLKTYRVSLGHRPVGPKQMEGDKRTPEGLYVIDRHNDRSTCYLAFHISYPKPEQVAWAAAHGVSAGGDVMIHGLRNGMGWIGSLHRKVDWTAGCIGVTDEEMDEIFRAVPDGTPIQIVP